jgi:hypothetical protein
MTELFGDPPPKRCCDCIGGCRCCPGWPQTASGSVNWTTTATANDCENGAPESHTGDFSCDDTEDPEGTPVRQLGTYLNVKVKCKVDPLTGRYRWVAEYRSAISGGTFVSPISTVFAEAENLEFSCPSCATGGTGTVDFIARQACETSGGVVEYDVLVHGEITIGCP